jgi:hypothetical protein
VLPRVVFPRRNVPWVQHHSFSVSGTAFRGSAFPIAWLWCLSDRRDQGRYVAWKDRLRAVFPGLALPGFPDTIIFPHLEKRFVKLSAQGYAATRGRPSGWMKQKAARPLVVAAWDAWATKRGLDNADATGRDALQFYYELQDVNSPLLKFISREREKWQVIHDWLVSERRIGL